MSSNQFQTLFGEIMRRRNQNAACLAGWTASVYSERGLAGAARAERRALPTQVPSGRQLRLPPLILMNYSGFQWFPINSKHFFKNYEEAKSKRSTFGGVGGLCWQCVWVGRRKRCRLPPCGICHRSPKHAGCSRCCLGQATRCAGGWQRQTPWV